MELLAHTRWLPGLLISFSVVTFAMAQPLYSQFARNRESFPAGALPPLLLVLVFQVAPVAVLFALDRLMARSAGTGGMLRAYRTGLFMLTFLSFLRQLDMAFSTEWTRSFSVLLKSGLYLVAFGLISGLCFYGYRALTLCFLYLAPGAALLSGVFAYQEAQFLGAGQRPQTAPSQQVSSRDRGPVFLIFFDELGTHVLLKDGHIDEERYPNFAALAQDSAWFANATTNYVASLLAFPSLLTGRYVSREDLKGDSLLQNNILGIFSSELSVYFDGLYFANVCFSKTVTCRGVFHATERYPQLFVARMGLRLFDLFVPQSVRVRFFRGIPGYSSRQALHLGDVQQFESFVDSIRAAEARGSLYYFHSMLSHFPFIYDEKGGLHSSPHTMFLPDADTAPIDANYARQVRFVDSLLGRFIAKLKAEGLYEEAIIVVTSDHGLRSAVDLNPSRPPEARREARVGQVPLFIRGPGIVPQVSYVDYQHMDFVPTLLDLLGLPPRDDLPGVSAFAQERPLREKLLFSINNGAYVFDRQSNTWRLISASEAERLRQP